MVSHEEEPFSVLQSSKMYALLCDVVTYHVHKYIEVGAAKLSRINSSIETPPSQRLEFEKPGIESMNIAYE